MEPPLIVSLKAEEPYFPILRQIQMHFKPVKTFSNVTDFGGGGWGRTAQWMAHLLPNLTALGSNQDSRIFPAKNLDVSELIDSSAWNRGLIRLIEPSSTG